MRGPVHWRATPRDPQADYRKTHRPEEPALRQCWPGANARAAATVTGQKPGARAGGGPVDEKGD